MRIPEPPNANGAVRSHGVDYTGGHFVVAGDLHNNCNLSNAILRDL